MRLERREGSFQKLLRDLIEGSLSASFDVLRDHVRYTDDILRLKIMDTGLDVLKPSLIAFVIACSGVEDAPGNDNKPKIEGDFITHKEHLESLFRIATGWLGWSPDVALSSSPKEIMEAYKGRTEMLKAIFGSSEKPKGDWGERAKAALLALNPKTVGGE